MESLDLQIISYQICILSVIYSHWNLWMFFTLFTCAHPPTQMALWSDQEQLLLSNSENVSDTIYSYSWDEKQSSHTVLVLLFQLVFD